MTKEWMRVSGQGLVTAVGLVSLLLMTGSEIGVLPPEGQVALASAQDPLALPEDVTLLGKGAAEPPSDASGFSEPPLAGTGPGSQRVFFSRLDAFSFPTEQELFGGLGLNFGPQVDRQYARLRESIIGSSREREAARRRCRGVLDAQEKSGTLEQMPEVDSLECYYLRWERLASKLAREIKEREREDEERFLDEEAESLAFASARKPKLRRLKSISDWQRLAGMSYRDAVSYFRPEGKQDALRLATLSLADDMSCSTAQARSGLMRAVENHLPDEDAFETLAAMYVLQKACLRPGDDSFEEIHFRMGLLFLERSRLEEAGTSLSFALEDTEGRDAYRVLFWRGLLEAIRDPESLAHLMALSSGQGDASESTVVVSNQFWQKLISNFPLSFHALVADSISGYSLHRKVLDQPMPWVGVFQGERWDAHNAGAFLYALFIARKDKRAMQSFSQKVINHLEPVTLEQGLFFGLAQQEAGFTRGAIKSMFQAASRYGSGQFNLAVLDRMYPRFYVKELEKHGSGVDLAFALSLMRQESSFNPKAISAARAMGLMQVLPSTARLVLRRSQINLLDPVQNIQAGSRYLNHLLKRYDDNYVHTIASYNAGPGKIVRWKERYLTTDALLFADLIPYRETRNYVSGLLRNIHWYRVLLNGDNHGELISNHETHAWTARSLVPNPAQWGLGGASQPVNLVFEQVPDFRRGR
jgi:soluble lytic murein transglycosylase